MAKVAQFIKRIEIESLWSGRKHIVWDLDREVNVLSGANGGGKSTIINRLLDVLRKKSDDRGYVNGDIPGVTVEFEPEDATTARFDIVRSLDNRMVSGNVMDRIDDREVRSELDWVLYELQRRYLDYQVNIGNKMIALLSSDDENSRQAAMDVSKPKTLFQDMVDDLFKDTQKKIHTFLLPNRNMKKSKRKRR